MPETATTDLERQISQMLSSLSRSQGGAAMAIPKGWVKTELPIETPHLFMWFCDGRKLGDSELPIPHKGKIDYCRTLVEEAAKLEASGTPAILVYKGSFLKSTQIEELAKFAQGVPNLYIADYDLFSSVVEHKREQDAVSKLFLEKVKRSADEFIRTKGRGATGSFALHPDQIGTVANIVDLARLALIYDCDSLLYSANIQKLPSQEMISVEGGGLLYRDLDVRLREDRMTKPLELLNGSACTTNLVDLPSKVSLLRRKRGKEELTTMQKDYLMQFTDPEFYARVYKDIALGENLAKLDEYEKKHQEIMGPDSSFTEDLIWFRKVEGVGMGVCVENSMIAVDGPKNKALAKSFKEDPNEYPYIIFQGAMWPDFTDLQKSMFHDPYYDQLSERILSSVESAHSIFNVTIDRTWIKGSDDLYSRKSSAQFHDEIDLFKTRHHRDLNPEEHSKNLQSLSAGDRPKALPVESMQRVRGRPRSDLLTRVFQQSLTSSSSSRSPGS